MLSDLHLQVKTLLDQVFIKNQFLERIKRELAALKSLQKFHFDPITDVTSITLAVPSFQPGKMFANDGLLILQGQFGREKPFQFIETEEFGRKVTAVCIGREYLLVGTSKTQLIEVIERNAKKQARNLPVELRKVLSSVDTKSMFWLASTLSADFRSSLRQLNAPEGLTGVTLQARSEERRVGKECRL